MLLIFTFIQKCICWFRLFECVGVCVCVTDLWTRCRYGEESLVSQTII